ncbi:MAG: CinA family nicotinamide mononucleotide deamidase-related protein [Pseudomonadota bacterium]
MRAEIIAVGTELLLGEIVNTNASFLASSLKDLGIDHHYQTVVGDNAERLSQVILGALSRADLIILTGGIGPTPDDLTHETLAKTFALELVEFPEVLVSMRNLFESRGRTMSSSNLKQAKLPVGSKLLANPIGTAWGVWLEPEMGKIVVTMPGVPTEMKKMWAEQVIPKLLEKGISRHKVSSRNYRIFGLPESKIAEMLGHHLDSDQPSVATYAETFGVRIRSASRSEAAVSEEILDRFEKGVILPLFSDFVYSSDGAALEAVVVSMLQKKKGSLLPWRSHAPVGCCQSCLRMSLEAPNGL